jgi:hypothetical protein
MVRYSTYSAVKNYITYGTQQYRTVRKQIRYAVRYGTVRYGTVPVRYSKELQYAFV